MDRLAQWWLRDSLAALSQHLKTTQQEQALLLQKLEHDLLALTFTVATSRSSDSTTSQRLTAAALDPHLGRQ